MTHTRYTHYVTTSGSDELSFSALLIAEEAPWNRAFGCTSKDPRVVQINPQSSAGACQMPVVGLASCAPCCYVSSNQAATQNRTARVMISSGCMRAARASGTDTCDITAPRACAARLSRSHAKLLNLGRVA
ncbi:hypothetical protein ISCGN_000711 [Ixodes scapularis]